MPWYRDGLSMESPLNPQIRVFLLPRKHIGGFYQQIGIYFRGRVAEKFVPWQGVALALFVGRASMTVAWDRNDAFGST